MTIDTCLLTKSGIILIVYVDDAILLSLSKANIQYEIKSLKYFFDLNDDDELKDYLGTWFEKNKNDDLITLTQLGIFKTILELIGLNYDDKTVKIRDTPECINKLLENEPYIKQRVQKWNYRAVVCCLSYYNVMVQPEITMASQQCAKFCN